jgi:hypothetical protein
MSKTNTPSTQKTIKHMKFSYLFLLIGALLFTAGCDQHHYRVLPKSETITVFRVHSKTNMLAEANPSNNWIYAYIITDGQNHYYKATAAERTKNYSSLQWKRVVANTLKEVLDAIPDALDAFETFDTEIVPTADLGMGLQQEIAIDIPYITSLDGVDTSGSTIMDSGSSSSFGGDAVGGDSMGGDTGGGDSGGGDSGGGDSGGGDGGGGDGGGGE